MPDFLIWDLPPNTAGVWKTITAYDERSAAEAAAGEKVRTIGAEGARCLRVRALDEPGRPAQLFYTGGQVKA